MKTPTKFGFNWTSVFREGDVKVYERRSGRQLMMDAM